MPKSSELGEILYVGTATVPVNCTVTEVAGAETLKVSVWLVVTGLEEVGRNATFTEQVAPTARAPPIGQLLVCANWLRLVPPTLMLLMVSEAVPVLVAVSVWTALEAFTGEVNVSGPIGVTESAGATPVPVRVTVCGLVGSEDAIDRTALRTPTAVGLNRT